MGNRCQSFRTTTPHRTRKKLIIPPCLGRLVLRPVSLTPPKIERASYARMFAKLIFVCTAIRCSLPFRHVFNFFQMQQGFFAAHFRNRSKDAVRAILQASMLWAEPFLAQAACVLGFSATLSGSILT